MAGLLDALGFVGDVLSTPGGLVRGLLAGDPGARYSGHELLQNYGLDPGDGVPGTLAGVGVDIATDPLTYMGGYLARRLLGGGFRPQSVGMGEKLGSDVYDLNAGHNFETGKLNPRVVHYPEVVPEAEPGFIDAAMSAEPGGPVAAPVSATPPPFSAVPAPGTYSHLTGMTDAGWDPMATIGGDMIRDGLPVQDAFRTDMGNWGALLQDMLNSPAASSRLQKFRPEGPIFNAADMANEQMFAALRNRAGDLNAVMTLPHAVSDFEALRPAVQTQLMDIEQLIGTHAASPAHEAVRDILSAAHRPGEAMQLLAPGGHLAHLPIDPAMLRRQAATSHEREVIQAFRTQLGGLTGGEAEVADLAHVYEPEYLRQRLADALNPDTYTLGGYEPNIVRRVLSATPETAYSRSHLAMLDGDAEMIAQVRDLLARLPAPPPVPPFRPLPPGHPAFINAEF